MASMAEIRAKLLANQKGGNGTQQRSGGDNASYPFWSADVGTTATVRFLPDGDTSNTFFWMKRETIKLPFTGVVGGEYPTNKPVTVTVLKGVVGIAAIAGETSTVTTVRVGYTENIPEDAAVTVGSGTTLTTWDQNGGSNTLEAAATTVGLSNGVLTTRGVGVITTFVCEGGIARPQSAGDITTFTLDGLSATADFTKSQVPRTVVNFNENQGNLQYDSGVVSITNLNQPSRPVSRTSQNI